MRQPPSSDPVQLPPELRARFQRLEGRLWRLETILALGALVAALAGSYLLFFLSDRFWDTPLSIRILLTLATVAVLGFFAWGWFRLWVWKRRDYRDLAEVVQLRYPRLGDRLLGIVELADDKRWPANISGALCRAAIHQVASEAATLDFQGAVSGRKSRRFVLVGFIALLLAATPALLFPGASWNALRRWLHPVSPVPRYTFVDIDQLPPRLIVAHGEPFEIACGVKLRTGWRPAEGSCRFEGSAQPEIIAPLRRGSIVFRVPGQTVPGVLRLRIGDASRRTTVEPTIRPALQTMLAQVQFPDYLQYPATNELLRSGIWSAVEGTRVRFQASLTRELAWAEMQAFTNASPQVLAVDGNRFLSPAVTIAGVGPCSFRWRDRLGLESSAPWTILLQSRPDTAPQVECTGQPVLAILEDEVATIGLGAEDDFGLRDLGVRWESRKGQETNVTLQGREELKPGSPRSRNLATNYLFSPALLHIPPDSTVTLQGVARDYYPGRPDSSSAPCQIHVLSREQHARFIQQQFERLSSELEDLTRREEALQEAGKEARQQPADKMKSDETARQLRQQADEQKAIGDKLQNLEKTGEEILQEAMRNKSISNESLKQWSEHLRKMQSLSAGAVPEASQALSSAEQQPAERAEQLDQALKKEQEIVQALQAMQNKMGSTLDQMLANTLAQRLRKVARTETDTQTDLQKNIGEIIGLMPEQLPPTHRQRSGQLAGLQDQASKATLQLTEEISRFYDRTSVTNFGAVASEMKEQEAGDSLARNAELIRKNIAVQAMQQAGEWAQKFTNWAAQLELANKEAEEQASNSEGEGQSSEAAMKRLLALLRLRLEEQGVRENTQWLEQRKRTHPTYRDDAIMLSLRQSLVADQAEQLNDEQPGKFLPQAQKAMQDADNILKKPATDDPAVAAETDAINLLEAEIQSMLKNSKSSSQSAAMAMMMQMMGMSPKPQPGGNYSGGEAEASNRSIQGDPRANGGKPRTARRTANRDTRPMPSEYRQALQNYYKAIEQLNP